MQGTVDRGRDPVVDEAVDQDGAAPRLGETVPVDGGDLEPADLEVQPVRVEPEAEVAAPEIAAPAVVVAADHEDREPPREAGQGCRHLKTAAGHDPGVAEPEIEEVAVDEQAVAQGRHVVQEGEERLFDGGWRHAEMGVGNDDESLPQHGGEDGSRPETPQRGRPELSLSRCPERLPPVKPPVVAPDVSETLVRVNYSETDQMGVVYHARYLVWLDVARTEHLRLAGMSYRELEAAGLRLVVGEVAIRYRQPARYDDRVRVRCWVRDLASRRIDFGYAVERVDDDHLLATAFTALLALDHTMNFTRLPEPVRQAMHPIPDPVPLHLAAGPRKPSTHGR